jgi:hypothetical protein
MVTANISSSVIKRFIVLKFPDMTNAALSQLQSHYSVLLLCIYLIYFTGYASHRILIFFFITKFPILTL